MSATARSGRNVAKIEVPPDAIADIRDVLARHNPGLSKTTLAATGEVMAAVSAVAARLSGEQQRRLVADKGGLAKALAEFPEDVTVAAKQAADVAHKIKRPADPRAEPWPPMKAGTTL